MCAGTAAGHRGWIQGLPARRVKGLFWLPFFLVIKYRIWCDPRPSPTLTMYPFTQKHDNEFNEAAALRELYKFIHQYYTEVRALAHTSCRRGFGFLRLSGCHGCHAMVATLHPLPALTFFSQQIEQKLEHNSAPTGLREQLQQVKNQFDGLKSCSWDWSNTSRAWDQRGASSIWQTLQESQNKILTTLVTQCSNNCVRSLSFCCFIQYRLISDASFWHN